MPALNGLTVLVPESRELDLFAAMLEEEGAAVFRCPLVRILPLEDSSDAEAWISRCIAGDFADAVFLTGEGVRHLVTIAGARRDALVSALGRIRKIVRGPKPVRALRALSLSADVSAVAPTSDGVLAVFAEENIQNRRIGVQLYPGERGTRLTSALQARGAIVDAVIPYRYASDAATADVRAAIAAIMAGKIGLIAFTATPQMQRLMDVAEACREREALMTALRHTPIAAIGPVVEESLQRLGLTAALSPQSSFHMKPLVRAIAAWKTGAA